jgi:hypothetical protein
MVDASESKSNGIVDQNPLPRLSGLDQAIIIPNCGHSADDSFVAKYLPKLNLTGCPSDIARYGLPW